MCTYLSVAVCTLAPKLSHEKKRRSASHAALVRGTMRQKTRAQNIPRTRQQKKACTGGRKSKNRETPGIPLALHVCVLGEKRISKREIYTSIHNPAICRETTNFPDRKAGLALARLAPSRNTAALPLLLLLLQSMHVHARTRARATDDNRLN